MDARRPLPLVPAPTNRRIGPAFTARLKTRAMASKSNRPGATSHGHGQSRRHGASTHTTVTTPSTSTSASSPAAGPGSTRHQTYIPPPLFRTFFFRLSSSNAVLPKPSRLCPPRLIHSSLGLALIADSLTTAYPEALVTWPQPQDHPQDRSANLSSAPPIDQWLDWLLALMCPTGFGANSIQIASMTC